MRSPRFYGHFKYSDPNKKLSQPFWYLREPFDTATDLVNTAGFVWRVINVFRCIMFSHTENASQTDIFAGERVLGYATL